MQLIPNGIMPLSLDFSAHARIIKDGHTHTHLSGYCNAKKAIATLVTFNGINHTDNDRVVGSAAMLCAMMRKL